MKKISQTLYSWLLFTLSPGIFIDEICTNQLCCMPYRVLHGCFGYVIEDDGSIMSLRMRGLEINIGAIAIEYREFFVFLQGKVGKLWH